MTAFVCSGRNLLKLSQGKSAFNWGNMSSNAMITPTLMPTAPQMSVDIVKAFATE